MGATLHRSRTSRRHRPIGEINVTPFVDVMLVLLIVFMVTAPLLTAGIDVDLPDSEGARSSTEQLNVKNLVVSMQDDGSIYLQETQINPKNLVSSLNTYQRPGERLDIYVRADRTVAYGEVLKLMGSIQAAGFDSVSLVAQIADQR